MDKVLELHHKPVIQQPIIQDGISLGHGTTCNSYQVTIQSSTGKKVLRTERKSKTRVSTA